MPVHNQIILAVLLTAGSIGGTVIFSSPTQAASFTSSKLSFGFNNFQIAPINPSADSVPEVARASRTLSADGKKRQKRENI